MAKYYHFLEYIGIEGFQLYIIPHSYKRRIAIVNIYIVYMKSFVRHFQHSVLLLFHKIGLPVIIAILPTIQVSSRVYWLSVLVNQWYIAKYV